MSCSYRERNKGLHMFPLRVSTMIFLGLFLTTMSVLCSCSGGRHPLNAYSPGDIVIGGLFPLHILTNGNTMPESCSELDHQSFLHTQVMIYAIREINQRTPRLLPNIQIGYDIYDTLGDVSVAIRATLQLLKNQSDPQSCLLPAHIHSALPEPQTKAVIGEKHSEVSIAVARVIALSSVAQISFASTSELLSRKLKFPTFLRTISSDEYQTKAIGELVKKFNWKTVAIVGSDDEYGKYGCDNLVEIFNEMKDTCIEFIHILPDYFSQNNSKTQTKLTELLGDINNSSAEAIILFTKGTNVVFIIEAAIRNGLNRTWIASDSWSTSTKLSALPGIQMAGEVFGFISKRNEVPGFKEYVMSAFNGTTNSILQHYLTCYPLCSDQSEDNEGTNCSFTKIQQGSKKCLDISCLVNYIDEDQSYNVYLAVQVIANSLRNLLKCDNHQCERSTNFKALELLKEIQKINFTVDSTHLFFDANGDPSLGYDILYWNMTRSKLIIQTIGEYWPNGKIKLPDDLVGYHRNVTVTAYNCSKTCEPGHELKQQNKLCCYNCVPCANGEFSTGNGRKCQRCNQDQYSSSQRNQCFKKQAEFLERRDPFVIFLSSLEVFGIIVSILFAVLFTIHRGTPIVKAVGGYLCFLELFAILVCFCLTFNFAGRPTVLVCIIGLPVFGIAFSLCISCILANLLQISVGFNFHVKTGSWMKKLNKPMAVVTIVSGVQLALCVPWLYLYPPRPASSTALSNQTILLYCDNGSRKFFLSMLGYNSLLALICFLFAFKGKQLPDLYKNASLITISMLLYLFVWIFFIPIYTNIVGKYKRAIESVAILISCYSILGCHLAPKCYMMVFRKEINNENAITAYIRKHYEQKGVAVVNS